MKRFILSIDGVDHDLTLEGHPGTSPTGTHFEVGATQNGTAVANQSVEVLSRSPDGHSVLLRVAARVVHVELPRCCPTGNTTVNGQALSVQCESELRRRAGAARANNHQGDSTIVAPLPGRVVRVHVQEGQLIENDAPLLSIEAMKMENELRSSRSGRVSVVHVAEGDTVETNQLLVSLVSD